MRRAAYSPRTYAAARAFDHEGQPVEVPAFALMAWHGALNRPAPDIETDDAETIDDENNN